MRVISGRAKGRKLKKVPGDTTRPMMDRVKENLFNILGMSVVDSRWLDLFAGTGQVGIEALSRGASELVFVDSARVAVRTIKANLAITQLESEAHVVLTDAFHYLATMPHGLFDLIYVAPPQYKGIWLEVMYLISQRPSLYLTPEGIVVVQIDPKEYEEFASIRLKLADLRRYGNTQLCFYHQL